MINTLLLEFSVSIIPIYSKPQRWSKLKCTHTWPDQLYPCWWKFVLTELSWNRKKKTNKTKPLCKHLKLHTFDMLSKSKHTNKIGSINFDQEFILSFEICTAVHTFGESWKLAQTQWSFQDKNANRIEVSPYHSNDSDWWRHRNADSKF